MLLHFFISYLFWEYSKSSFEARGLWHIVVNSLYSFAPLGHSVCVPKPKSLRNWLNGIFQSSSHFQGRLTIFSYILSIFTMLLFHTARRQQSNGRNWREKNMFPTKIGYFLVIEKAKIANISIFMNVYWLSLCGWEILDLERVKESYEW